MAGPGLSRSQRVAEIADLYHKRSPTFEGCRERERRLVERDPNLAIPPLDRELKRAPRAWQVRVAAEPILGETEAAKAKNRRLPEPAERRNMHA